MSMVTESVCPAESVTVTELAPYEADTSGPPLTERCGSLEQTVMVMVPPAPTVPEPADAPSTANVAEPGVRLSNVNDWQPPTVTDPAVTTPPV